MHNESAVSVRIDSQTRAGMALHDEVNWSGVIRHAIQKKLDELETPVINRKRARDALVFAAQLRKMSSVTSKSAAEVIREWREKRR